MLCVLFSCSAGDGTQGLLHLGKCSTTELHPHPQVKNILIKYRLKNAEVRDE
jgi:hypothetical protein